MLDDKITQRERQTYHGIPTCFVICGIFILLLDALVAFMPYITDYYYEYILPKYYEHPIAMRPKAFYAKLAPYMSIFFMLCLLTLCFGASFL